MNHITAIIVLTMEIRIGFQKMLVLAKFRSISARNIRSILLQGNLIINTILFKSTMNIHSVPSLFLFIKQACSVRIRPISMKKKIQSNLAQIVNSMMSVEWPVMWRANTINTKKVRMGED